jgi:hypothetical protein
MINYTLLSPPFGNRRAGAFLFKWGGEQDEDN